MTAHRREVQEKLNEALHAHQHGIPIAPERQTVAQFLERWLTDVVKPGVRPKTHRTYSDLVRLHLSPVIGKCILSKLGPQDVRQMLNAKLAAKLSPRTVKHLLVTLRGALAVAEKWGLVPRNVATLVDPPYVPRNQMQIFTPDEARCFLAAVEGDRLEALFTVGVSLGMREGEILGLRWPDVDLEGGTLTVNHALQRVDGKLILVEPKRASSRRPLPLPGVTLSALVRRQAKQEEERLLAGDQWAETGFVFTTRKGTPIDPRNIIRCFHAILKREQLPQIRFHDLRHSAATFLLSQGVNPRYVTELLGHSQVSFTMQTYGHVLTEVQKEVATKMDSILQAVPSSQRKGKTRRVN